MHLLDTEVVWALRATRSDADLTIRHWTDEQARTGLFISALTLAELGAVAAQAERTDRNAGGAIRRWIDGPVMTAFDGCILPVDAAVARHAATLAHPHQRDGLFAATALVHGLILATRTPAAYRIGKVKTVNPWTASPRRDSDDGDWRQASRSPLWIKSLFARG